MVGCDCVALLLGFPHVLQGFCTREPISSDEIKRGYTIVLYVVRTTSFCNNSEEVRALRLRLLA